MNALLRYETVPESEPAAVLRVPLASVARTPQPGRSQPCPRCGSHGFTVHQRSGKAVKDPHLSRVSVDRYRCKRCGWVGRTYPAGIGPGRQSVGQVQLTLLLYSAGLSYATVRGTLASLGCDVSETTVRHNMAAALRDAPAQDVLGRLQLDVVGVGRLAGDDGALQLRIAGPSPADRWLEIEIDPGPRASELQWRLERSARWMREVAGAEQYPPESADHLTSRPRFVVAS